MKDWQIEPFSKQIDRKTFDCGVEPLNRFFQTQASQELKRKVCAIYVAVEGNSPTVGGFYTLSATSARLQKLPEAVKKKLPRYPDIPSFLIGRLAVSTCYQGEGLGKFLLIDALVRCLHLSVEIGASLVLVDAKDESAVRFYEKFEFQVLDESRLFLPMTTISKLN